MKLSYFFKIVSNELGLKSIALYVYFKLLGLKYGVKLFRQNGRISLIRHDKKIIIKHGTYDFGSSGLVIRDFDAFFNSVEYESHNSYKVVDYSCLRRHKMLNIDEFFWSHGIIDPENVTEIYLNYSKIGFGSVVLDVGTYSGVQTVRFSKIVGNTGKVYAFEPDKESFETLLMNLSEHKCDNVIALNYGLYDFDGVLCFNSSGGMGAGVDMNGNDEIVVKTLSTTVEELKIDKIDFIKMDIEGSEVPVLTSSREILRNFKPRLIVEPHYINGRLNDKEIMREMMSNGYKCEVIAQGEFDHQPLLYFFCEK
jgi:FkbM family methyltransferase